MRTRFLVMTLLLALPLAAAGRDRPVYLGLQIADYTLDVPPVQNALDDEEPTMRVGRLGYRFNRNLAIEGRLANSRTHDPVAAAFTRIALDLYQADVYALVGASTVRPNGFGIENEDNLALGAGVTLYGSRHRTINLEYVSYSDGALYGFGLGFVMEFGDP